ncbi:hypothetical protein AB0L88_33360 [Saccharopolyspora shandongensis]|uniref:hypothetical protein n=1 Tax=Saccharopolyspora shandongensis TaxID=418495 RepID=UPI00341FD694
MGQDADQVVLGEPPGDRRRPECPIDLGDGMQLGQRDCLGHLRPDPPRPGRGGLDQPGRGAGPEREERGLLDRGRLRRAFTFLVLLRRVVLLLDQRGSRHGPRVPCDLGRAVLTDRGGDQFVAEPVVHVRHAPTLPSRIVAHP